MRHRRAVLPGALIRDVKFLTTLSDRRDRVFGEQLREGLRELFGPHPSARDAEARAFLRSVWRRARPSLALGAAAPPTRHSQNLARALRQAGQAYFEFITTPGVEPTNNLRTGIRFVVIDRRISKARAAKTAGAGANALDVSPPAPARPIGFEYLSAAVTALFERTPRRRPYTHGD